MDAGKLNMQAHTRESGAELILEHYDDVHRRALSLTGNADHASDLTQETFTKVLEIMQKGADIMYPGKYLFTALRHLFFKEMYANKERPLSAEDMDEYITAHDPEKLNEPGRTDNEGLWREINGLEEKFRKPVILFYFNELSYKNIAKTLGVPVGTVMSRISRGKRYLKLKLNSGQYGFAHQD